MQTERTCINLNRSCIAQKCLSAAKCMLTSNTSPQTNFIFSCLQLTVTIVICLHLSEAHYYNGYLQCIIFMVVYSEQLERLSGVHNYNGGLQCTVRMVVWSVQLKWLSAVHCYNGCLQCTVIIVVCSAQCCLQCIVRMVVCKAQLQCLSAVHFYNSCLQCTITMVCSAKLQWLSIV